MLRVVGPFLVVAVLSACSPDAAPGDGSPEVQGQGTPTLAIEAQHSGTDVLLQAVSPVDGDTVWVSGHGGSYAVTVDGGATWTAAVMPGEETLQFRDVHAFDARAAVLMSAGEGGLSRIYRTEDGGATWTLQYRADHPDAFLDCMSFWDRDRGVVFGDEVDGVPFILRTEDGGTTWTRVPANALPDGLEGEGGFAASGTCLVTGRDGTAWIATGNAGVARVLRTSDWGRTWTAAESPVVSGPGAGHTTIRMDGAGQVGIALGGVIGNDTTWSDNVVVTRDGGASWTLAQRPAMPGPVYGSALVPQDGSDAVVAVGPKGLVWSHDLAGNWVVADTTTYWAVAFAEGGMGWAVGPQGTIARLVLRRP